MKEPRKPAPRIGRKDQQDPDRGARDPRAGAVDRKPERSDREAGAGPMQIDRSARRRWGEPASAAEWIATVSIPIARQARSTRAAISPRLAMRMRRNIGSF